MMSIVIALGLSNGYDEEADFSSNVADYETQCPLISRRQCANGKAMNKGYAWVLAGAALVMGASGSGGEEKVDWGRLADYWLATEVKPQPEIQGPGGIRVGGRVVMDQETEAWYRRHLQAIENRPDPKQDSKPTLQWWRARNTFELKGVADPINGKRGFPAGDWNRGVPFVEAGKAGKPRG